MDRGFVKVDEYCQTNVPTISAVGDLIPTPQLAHVGFGEGILVAERLAGLRVGADRLRRRAPGDLLRARGRLGRAHRGAGRRAVRRGRASRRCTYDLAGNGKSQILRTAGAVKLVAEKDGPVVGVHMVGGRVGELLAEAQLIYNWEALPAEVAQLIHAHPTQSEAMGEAHLALAGKPLHVHG